MYYPWGFMRLLSQMHSSFRSVSGSLSVRSSSSFYLLALLRLLSVSLVLSFAELSTIHFIRHAQTRPFSHPPSFSSSLAPLSFCNTNSCSFLALKSSSVFLVLFIFYITVVVRSLSRARIQTAVDRSCPSRCPGSS